MARMKRSYRIAVAVAWVAALVTGCATYTPEPLSHAVNADTLDSRTLDDPRLLKFIAFERGRDGETGLSLRWDLTTLTFAAIYYHPDLDIAHSKLAGAEARVITAAQVPNPSLS